MKSNFGSQQGSLTLGQKSIGILIALIVLVFVGKTVYAIFPTASNQGYQPDQPIPFSHKIHAGDNKIDCQYCHVGARKSRHAGIPALNVCMNCHRVVKTESPHIQNLQEHYNSGKPVEWLRIHELPDIAFFNHRPHIDKGVSCETCHGDVKTMDKVYQAMPLTMGWCINCHRGNTTPKDVLKKIHPDVEDPTGLHVAPTNCSTCHY